MNACIDRIIKTINIRKKMMLQSITTEIMKKLQLFFTDNQNLWRKSRFHELGIRRMPRFLFLICTLHRTFYACVFKHRMNPHAVDKPFECQKFTAFIM